MHKVQAALIKEQGVTFAVVLVKRSACTTNSACQETLLGVSHLFQGYPTIIAWEDGTRGLRYFGRKDIVEFLSNVHPSYFPWKEYSFS